MSDYPDMSGMTSKQDNTMMIILALFLFCCCCCFLPAVSGFLYYYLYGSGYKVTITYGTGGGYYEEGDEISIKAKEISGKEFDVWTGDVSNVEDIYDEETIVTIGTENVSLEATYKDIVTTESGNGTEENTVSSSVTIVSGTGGGTYEEGATVIISADTPPAGTSFDTWSGDVSVLSSPTSPNTTFTMSDEPVSLLATYTDIPKYTLSVTDGLGSGSYKEGDVVTVTAGPPVQDKEFDAWIGDTSYLSSLTAESVSVTMPAQNISVSATYKNTISANLATESAGATQWYLRDTDDNIQEYSGFGLYPQGGVVNNTNVIMSNVCGTDPTPDACKWFISADGRMVPYLRTDMGMKYIPGDDTTDPVTSDQFILSDTCSPGTSDVTCQWEYRGTQFFSKSNPDHSVTVTASDYENGIPKNNAQLTISNECGFGGVSNNVVCNWEKKSDAVNRVVTATAATTAAETAAIAGATLTADQTLGVNDRLVSVDGGYTVFLDDKGNLYIHETNSEIYKQPLFLPVESALCATCKVVIDDNSVTITNGTTTLRTFELLYPQVNAPMRMVLQNEGELQIIDGRDLVVWRKTYSQAQFDFINTLTSGNSLSVGQSKLSPNNEWKFGLDTNGCLVVTKVSDGVSHMVLWGQSACTSCTLEVTNTSIVTKNGTVTLDTLELPGTVSGPLLMRISDSGKLYVTDADNIEQWSLEFADAEERIFNLKKTKILNTGIGSNAMKIRIYNAVKTRAIIRQMGTNSCLLQSYDQGVIKIRTCASGTTKWNMDGHIIKTIDGYWQQKGPYPYLTAHPAYTENARVKVTSLGCSGGGCGNQKWTHDPISGKIMNTGWGSSKVLTADGEYVKVSTWTGAANQRWQFYPA